MNTTAPKISAHFAAMSKDELAAEYVKLIGYDPFQDCPTITENEVRQTLTEFMEESIRESEQ